MKIGRKREKERDEDREGERGRERKRGRERDRKCFCLCVRGSDIVVPYLEKDSGYLKRLLLLKPLSLSESTICCCRRYLTQRRCDGKGKVVSNTSALF